MDGILTSFGSCGGDGETCEVGGGGGNIGRWCGGAAALMNSSSAITEEV